MNCWKFYNSSCYWNKTIVFSLFTPIMPFASKLLVNVFNYNNPFLCITKEKNAFFYFWFVWDRIIHLKCTELCVPSFYSTLINREHSFHRYCFRQKDKTAHGSPNYLLLIISSSKRHHNLKQNIRKKKEGKDNYRLRYRLGLAPPTSSDPVSCPPVSSAFEVWSGQCWVISTFYLRSLWRPVGLHPSEHTLLLFSQQYTPKGTVCKGWGLISGWV